MQKLIPFDSSVLAMRRPSLLPIFVLLVVAIVIISVEADDPTGGFVRYWCDATGKEPCELRKPTLESESDRLRSWFTVRDRKKDREDTYPHPDVLRQWKSFQKADEPPKCDVWELPDEPQTAPTSSAPLPLFATVIIAIIYCTHRVFFD
ncbi:unnamed protein product, partial [Mesorhabditis spiculigera]